METTAAFKFRSQSEITKRFMKESPINEAFVITALFRFSKEVIEKQDEIRKEMANGFISPEVWILTAKNWLDNYKTPIV